MTDHPEDPGGSRTAAITVDDDQDIPIDEGVLASAAARALDALGVPQDAQLAITLVDPARMAELKREALGVHAATDVLSFPMDDLDDPSPGPLVLGDIVLCPAVAQRQARGLGIAFEDELRELCVHGILHLLGRDHADLASERAMWDEQRRVVGAIGATA